MPTIKTHWRGLQPGSRASPMGHGRRQGSIPKASISAAVIEPPASRFPGRFVPWKISARLCQNSSRPRGKPRAAGHRTLEEAAPRKAWLLFAHWSSALLDYRMMTVGSDNIDRILSGIFWPAFPSW